ncbi:AAA family ATPase [Paracoccaceae bacterium]|nr:AAA family ATPase [Paracoccaceae bacterium]
MIQKIRVSWADWSPRMIDKYHLKKTGKNHYNGPCPQCGGHDRFFISEKNGALLFNCNQGCEFKQLVEIMRNDGTYPKQQATDAFTRTPTKASDFSQPLYHERKGVELIDAQLDGSNLRIPISDASEQNVGWQTISPDGTKRFDKGMQTDGCFAILNGPIEGTVYLCEGYATAASVVAATGCPAVHCLSASNLPKVALILAKIAPEAKLIIAADNDKPGLNAANQTGLPWTAPSENGADWNDRLQAEGADTVNAELTRNLKQPGTTKKARLLVKASDYKLTKPEYWVEGIIEKDALTFMVGASGCGKTFVATDVATSIGLGIEYHGRQVKQGHVIISAGEGQDGQVARLRAAAEHKGKRLENAEIYLAKQAVVFADENAVLALCQEIEENHKGKVAVIIIDTMARAMVGTDENSSKDMSAFIHQCDHLRERFGCSIIVVHHTGHEGSRGRGSSARYAAADAEIIIKAEGGKVGTGGKICMSFEKTKNAKTPASLYFSTETRLLHDEKAETFDTLVLNAVDAPEQANKNTKLTTGETMALKTFKAAQLAKTPDIENVATTKVELEEWREHFRRQHTGNSDKSKDTVFSRNRQGLVNKGYLTVEDNIYSLGNMTTS